MKKLKDCEEEIYKCSKCGLCQGVCPVFKITKNEAALSRGKFLMLLSYLQGKIPFSKTMQKYLNMCTSCGACSNFCPSGIDANKIFNLAKFEQKFSNPSIPKFFGKIFYHFSKINPKAKFCLNMAKNCPEKDEVIFFEGCYSKFVNSISKKSTLNIFNKLNLNIKFPNFACCGIVAQSFGDAELFEKFMKHNLNILKNPNIKYILFDCATCLEVVKNYDKYFEIENFDGIKNKCFSVVEFLQMKNVKFKSPKTINITYHKPCHLDYDPQTLLKNIENVNYIQMPDFDKCCGFSGKFAVTHRKIANQMYKEKAKNINSTGVSTVLTLCPGCIEGLKQAKKFTQKKPKILNVIDFLANLEIIS